MHVPYRRVEGSGAEWHLRTHTAICDDTDNRPYFGRMAENKLRVELYLRQLLCLWVMCTLLYTYKDNIRGRARPRIFQNFIPPPLLYARHTHLS